MHHCCGGRPVGCARRTGVINGSDGRSRQLLAVLKTTAPPGGGAAVLLRNRVSSECALQEAHRFIKTLYGAASFLSQFSLALPISPFHLGLWFLLELFPVRHGDPPNEVVR